VGGTFDASGRYASYGDYAGRENDSRGTVIALASRVPFNLERIESDGDWNIVAIRRLIEHRSPGSAAYALAAYLGAKGEPIGRDYMRFASARHYYYASNSLYDCDLYYGAYSPTLALRRLAVLDQVARLQQAGQSARILGYDFCGMPIIAFGPVRPVAGSRPTPPENPKDTSGARGHFPTPIPRSGPQPGTAPRAAKAFYPITRRAETPQMGDVTITAPSERTRDPREIFIDLANQGRGSGIQRAGVPLTRTAPTGSETTVIGTQQPAPREYSKPVFHEAPPPRYEPPRGPDRSAPPPPPVVQERPVSPPPPPPRAESAPRSKPVQDPPPPTRH
jgi:hypothetical protein